MSKQLDEIIAAGSIALLLYLIAKGLSGNQEIFICSNCNERFVVSKKGGVIKCPKCGKILVMQN